MKILVTGTAGFIGFSLAKHLLEEGHEVCGLDAFTPYYDVKLKRDRNSLLESFPGFQVHEVYLENMDDTENAYRNFQPDVTVHLAAQAGVRYSLEHPRAYVDSNVVGSFNIIELAKRYDTGHLLFAATSSVYGANDEFPFKETARTAHPLTIYAATKAATEQIGHCYSHLYNIPTTVFRFFSIYGPWGRPDMALFLFTERMIKGEPIDVYNHGDMVRNFTYIDDLIESIRRLMDCPPTSCDGSGKIGEFDSLSPVAPYRIVNIGGMEEVNLMDYIKEIEKACGIKAEMNLLGMQPGDVRRNSSDTTLLKALTSYSPSTPVSEGVPRFVRWYRDYYQV